MSLNNLSMARGWGLALLRVVFGIVLLVEGYKKLMVNTPAGFGDAMLAWAGPLALTLAWIVTIVEIVAGILLIIGLWTRWAALLGGIIMLVAFIQSWATMGWGDARLPLALTATALTLLFQGSGKASADDAMNR